MRSENQNIASDQVTLAGTLTGPDDGSKLLVICIHGSGPLDRDQNTPGQKLDIFNAIAADLAAAGIDTYRYDKRGVGESTGDYWRAGIQELIADVKTVVSHFDSINHYDEIYLLGHSEGTIIAPIVALNTPVGGLILLCPFSSPMKETLRAQAAEMKKHIEAQSGIQGVLMRFAQFVMGDVEVQQQKLISRVEDSTEPYFRVRMQRINAKWLRELLAFDAIKMFEKVSTPTLVVRADKDIQCNPKDANDIAETIGEGATLVGFENMTHLLRESDEPSGFGKYQAQMAQPMSPKISNTIVEWIKTQRQSGKDNVEGA